MPTDARRLGLLRLLSHMFIVSVFAPAMGGAVYTFTEAEWHGAMFIVRLFGSLLGGFVLLAFSWFWTIPLGLLTYVLCLVLRRCGMNSVGPWMLAGAAVGLLFGQFIALWAKISLMISAGSGVSIGVLTGLALRQIWCMGEKAVAAGDDVGSPRSGG